MEEGNFTPGQPVSSWGLPADCCPLRDPYVQSLLCLQAPFSVSYPELLQRSPISIVQGRLPKGLLFFFATPDSVSSFREKDQYQEAMPLALLSTETNSTNFFF